MSETSRRGFLAGLFAGGARRDPARPPKTVVSVFLRGGADGLGMVVPHGDPAYAGHRPTLALAAPGQGSSACLDLDGFFGLHPAFAPLLPAWRARRLALVHAIGSDDTTRSHFEAQDRMEHGHGGGLDPAGGWAGRYLRALEGAGGFSAVAVGPRLPECLRGAPCAAAMTRLETLGLATDPDEATRVAEALGALYGADPLLAQAGRDTLVLMEKTRALAGPAPAGDAYPAGGFGAGLRDVARMIKAGLGLRVAALELGAWDTHHFQGTTGGLLAGRIAELADGLAAFDADLGAGRDEVVVVVMTEFGRRAHENASLGTDHGRGSVMLVLGAGLAGGKVHGRWPGLADRFLDGPGDLAVTTDYRDALAEVLAHAGGVDPGRVFPGHRPAPVGLVG